MKKSGTKSQEVKYQNLCYKCSIGRHSQHSFFTGKGLMHYLTKEGLANDPNICQCQKCKDKSY